MEYLSEILDRLEKAETPKERDYLIDLYIKAGTLDSTNYLQTRQADNLQQDINLRTQQLTLEQTRLELESKRLLQEYELERARWENDRQAREQQYRYDCALVEKQKETTFKDWLPVIGGVLTGVAAAVPAVIGAKATLATANSQLEVARINAASRQKQLDILTSYSENNMIDMTSLNALDKLK